MFSAIIPFSFFGKPFLSCFYHFFRQNLTILPGGVMPCSRRKNVLAFPITRFLVRCTGGLKIPVAWHFSLTKISVSLKRFLKPTCSAGFLRVINWNLWLTRKMWIVYRHFCSEQVFYRRFCFQRFH